MKMRRWPTTRLFAYALAVVVLLTVFSLYLQPDFMVQMAQMVWACF